MSGKVSSPDGVVQRVKREREKKDKMLKGIKKRIRELYDDTKDITTEEFLHIFTDDLKQVSGGYYVDENKDKDEVFEDFLEAFCDALEKVKEDTSVEEIEEFLTDLDFGLYRDFEDLLDIPIPIFS